MEREEQLEEYSVFLGRQTLNDSWLVKCTQYRHAERVCHIHGDLMRLLWLQEGQTRYLYDLFVLSWLEWAENDYRAHTHIVNNDEQESTFQLVEGCVFTQVLENIVAKTNKILMNGQWIGKKFA